MDSAWMKDVLVQLLIGVGSGILLILCSYLCKLILNRWQSYHARRSALRARPATPDELDSGEQSLPHADASHDVEMGSLHSHGVADLPGSLCPDNTGNAAEEEMEMTSHTLDGPAF